MTDVTLREITQDNWQQCIGLKLHASQVNFVASNVYSLAEAHYVPNNFPRGIYVDETMVGFLMYGFEELGGYKLWYIARLMIAADYQGKGYGEAALRRLIQQLRDTYDPDGVCISYAPENVAAARLYAKLGFLDEGTMLEDEILARLPFRDES